MDTDLISKLIKLPWDLQIMLGSGYLAYLLAYVGIRHNHKSNDAIFITLAFGMVAALSISMSASMSLAARMGTAVASCLIAAIIWRKLGRGLLRRLLRFSGHSWADDTASAWDHIQENDRHHPCQLAVETADGHTFFCTDTAKVEDLPHGPYVLGTAGDVLMYADKSQAPDASDPSDVDGFRDKEWGANVTYIPANQVRRIAIRYTPQPAKAVTSAGEAVGWKARVRASVARMLRHLAKAVEPGD